MQRRAMRVCTLHRRDTFRCVGLDCSESVAFATNVREEMIKKRVTSTVRTKFGCCCGEQAIGPAVLDRQCPAQPCSALLTPVGAHARRQKPAHER